jgi:pimeloyl-ACP methyl ester carboxylesterase
MNPGYFNTVDGVRIFYQTNFEIGSKLELPLLVFNYGLVCNFEHWKHQIPFFEELGFPILMHHYRGHFSSSGNDHLENINFLTMAADLNGLIQSLKVETPVIMFGHSMGVNVTLEYAKQYPTSLAKMILISGTVLPPQDVMFGSNAMDLFLPLVAIIKEKFPQVFKQGWETSFLNPILKELVFQGGFNTKKTPREFVEVYLKRIGQLKPELFLQLMKEMHDHDIIAHLENIKTPTLIISGDKDKIIPHHLQLILKKYLINSEYYVMKDGSHVPQVDFPDTINERMLIFIQDSFLSLAPKTVDSSPL